MTDTRCPPVRRGPAPRNADGLTPEQQRLINLLDRLGGSIPPHQIVSNASIDAMVRLNRQLAEQELALYRYQLFIRSQQQQQNQ